MLCGVRGDAGDNRQAWCVSSVTSVLTGPLVKATTVPGNALRALISILKLLA